MNKIKLADLPTSLWLALAVVGGFSEGVVGFIVGFLIIPVLVILQDIINMRNN